MKRYCLAGLFLFGCETNTIEVKRASTPVVESVVEIPEPQKVEAKRSLTYLERHKCLHDYLQKEAKLDQFQGVTRHYGSEFYVSFSYNRTHYEAFKNDIDSTPLLFSVTKFPNKQALEDRGGWQYSLFEGLDELPYWINRHDVIIDGKTCRYPKSGEWIGNRGKDYNDSMQRKKKMELFYHLILEDIVDEDCFIDRQETLSTHPEPVIQTWNALRDELTDDVTCKKHKRRKNKKKRK